MGQLLDEHAIRFPSQCTRTFSRLRVGQSEEVANTNEAKEKKKMKERDEKEE